MSGIPIPEYGYKDAAAAHTAAYLMPAIRPLLPTMRPGMRVLDLGCGNGFHAGWLVEAGCHVIGVDASAEGIEHARQKHPTCRFECALIEPDLLRSIGEEPVDLVLSTEVIEHIYAPRDWAASAFRALRPGGRLICSTPYHGYLKNLALSITDHWDQHLGPLWDGGHIKFWSRRTLGRLLAEQGFVNERFAGAGRLPFLWMSMVMSADRPS